MISIFRKKWDCINRIINLELKVESLKKENDDLKDLVMDLTVEIAQLSVQVKHAVELAEKHKAL